MVSANFCMQKINGYCFFLMKYHCFLEILSSDDYSKIGRYKSRTGSTLGRINSDQLGSNKKIKIKSKWTRINSEQQKKI